MLLSYPVMTECPAVPQVAPAQVRAPVLVQPPWCCGVYEDTSPQPKAVPMEVPKLRHLLRSLWQGLEQWQGMTLPLLRLWLS